jgi:phosphopantetheinyl transferase
MIRWLLARDNGNDVLAGYLHPAEHHEGDRYRHPGRHRQWLFGRAAAKHLLVTHSGASQLPALGPRGLWIHRTEAGWPQVLDGSGCPLPVSLSIAHTSNRALCAMCPQDEGSLGVDMETVASRPQAFLEDFYTDGERQRLATLPTSTRDATATLIWAIKEAVLKARLTGLAANAKSVDVLEIDLLPSTDWSRAEVRLEDGQRPEVFWRWVDDGATAMAIARCTAADEAT